MKATKQAAEIPASRGVIPYRAPDYQPPVFVDPGFAAAAKREAFFSWHRAHAHLACADSCRDLENAEGVLQNGYAIGSAEYWECALASARQALEDDINKDAP